MKEPAEFGPLAAEIVPVLQELGVHREATVAWVLFQEAVEAERVTAELIRQLVRFLEGARVNPGLRFAEPP